MREWLEGEVNSDRPFALAGIAVSGFLRIVTNARIYHRPTALDTAIAFVDGPIEQPTCLPTSAGARANLVPDAHLAAIAIENGATVATRDRGFARFPGLRWIDPLSG